MKKIVSLAIAATAIALPGAAFAQDNAAEVTVGASVGIHDLGVPFEEIDGFEIDDSGEIYGGFVAVDFPVGESIFFGIEGNVHLGSGPIDAEYGASARLGFRASNGSKFYVRGGYQEVDLDVGGLIGNENIIDDDDPLLLDTDTTIGDYLVGAGADFAVGESVSVRVNLDTIAFDSFRATAGVGFRF